MHERKAGLLQMTFINSTTGQTQEDLGDFEKK